MPCWDEESGGRTKGDHKSFLCLTSKVVLFYLRRSNLAPVETFAIMSQWSCATKTMRVYFSRLPVLSVQSATIDRLLIRLWKKSVILACINYSICRYIIVTRSYFLLFLGTMHLLDSF